MTTRAAPLGEATRAGRAAQLGRLGTLGRVPPIALVLGAGLLLRIVLGFVLTPGQGFATDLGLFASWAQTAASVGPGAFYESARSANYPPGYIDVLWLVGTASQAIASVTGWAAADVLPVLLKVPAVTADLLIALLLYGAGRRWFGERRGVLAAALFLFIPVSWYDSALWGQVDSVAALFMLAALVLLIDGWSEPAAMAATLGVLMKPQGIVVFAILVPVLVRRHLVRPGSGPVPSALGFAAASDRRLDTWFTRHQGPDRLASSAVAALVVAIVVVLPFDLPSLAPASVADLPVIAHIAGLATLLVDTANQYAVLTANAFNGWALVGANPLASTMATGGSANWITDALPVIAGVSAVTIGALMLAATAVVVVAGLLIREDRVRILLGFTVVAFAFYALPTRVHERYLFPAFVTGALLAASLAPVAWYLLLGLLNTVNLHAVLANGGSGGAAGRPTRAPGGFGGGAGQASGPGGQGFGPGGGTSIRLPFGDLARSDVVVAAVAVGQTVLFVALLAAYVSVVVIDLRRAIRSSRRPPRLASETVGRNDPEVAAILRGDSSIAIVTSVVDLVATVSVGPPFRYRKRVRSSGPPHPEA